MNMALPNSWQVSSFDTVVERFSESPISFSEKEALKSSHWDLGEDARLREDARFRPTPWGRWILASHLLANGMLYRLLRQSERSEIPLVNALADLQRVAGRPLMFCPKDPRFVFEQDVVRLAANELTDRPKIENPLELEKYVTHLPLHSLEAVAASEPAGEWGPGAQEEMIETEGWMRVRLPGLRLNDRMFVAKVKGSSMDNGRSGLVDGSYAVFELWPSGTKQEQVVLVRGAFHDPETGSYAVKKYIGDVRDAEGRHKVITLVSLNPDKEHYPDIVLEPEQDDDLTVVARLIAPLSPGDYGREPKQRRKAGKRDLRSPDGQRKVAERLKSALQKFFEGIGTASEGAESEEKIETAWSARFICLEAAGGLQIEAGPLIGLPSFARKLQVISGTDNWPVIASNFRTKSWRIEVKPSFEKYCWSAPGFEDDLDEGLKALALPGLSAIAATPFRIDGAGIGIPLAGTEVSPGQSYRLIIPPKLSAVKLPTTGTIALGDGWRLWELLLPAFPDPNLRSLLSSLGLVLGKSAPCISWVVISPALYRTAPSGESYPCFPVERPPILNIQGIESESDGDTIVFLSGAGTTNTFPLPAGNSWSIEFDDLSPGEYMVEVLHANTDIEPARLPFAVEDALDVRLDARIDFVIDGRRYELGEVGQIIVKGDFSLLERSDQSISINGPSLWPVTVTWHDGKLRRLKFHALERDGSLNVELLGVLTEDLRSRSRVVNLVIDFRELGRLTLQLDRLTDPNVLAELIRIQVLEKLQSIEGLIGQFPLMRSLWLDPLLKMMNYNVSDFKSDELEEAPAGTTALKLLETSRLPQGDVREELRRVLILTTATADLRDSAEGSVRVFADSLCWKCGVVEAIITDGVRWFLHKRGSKMRPAIWDLREISHDSDSFDMDAFLSNCAVGV